MVSFIIRENTICFISISPTPQWECPDYFETAGGKALVLSVIGLGDTAQELPCSVCMPVDFDEKTCVMDIPRVYQLVDYGMDLYAPQSTLDKEGRRIMVGWMFRTEFAAPQTGLHCHLDIYVDKNLVEVFVNNGEYVISNVVYGLGCRISTSSGKRGIIAVCDTADRKK